MSQPKQATWFAWNSAAREQILDFWGTKMVLESQRDDVDPDSNDSSAVRNRSAQLVTALTTHFAGPWRHRRARTRRS
eukprot:5469500-Pyramimonas_sp.AAC.1